MKAEDAIGQELFQALLRVNGWPSVVYVNIPDMANPFDLTDHTIVQLSSSQIYKNCAQLGKSVKDS